MAAITATKKNKLAGRFSFRRGVHPPENKQLTAGMFVKSVRALPGSVMVIPMLQHIGAECEPKVEPKQEVSAGQLLGDNDAFVSAPVHSPVNGVIKSISPQPHPYGRKVLSVVITVSDDQPKQQRWRELIEKIDFEQFGHEVIIKKIRQAGIVGMGGAAFPTSMKLTWNPQRPVNTVLVNGCECEPYLTSDHRLMLEAPEMIVIGLQLSMRAIEAKSGIIAIEDNKPDAIRTLLAQVKNIPNIKVAVCQTKYPQGGEKQLINAVLGRVVPTGGLPREVKTVVINVGTSAAIAWACAEDRPVTERIVTVTGGGINEPGNYRVPVGMLLSDLIERCGGLTEDAQKVLMGGPMMGPAIPHLNVPILKSTSGITVMDSSEIQATKESACIRCSRCVDYCPLGLVPTRIAHAIKARNIEMALEYDLFACCECGCCSYVCPAQIPLLQYLRSGKAMAKKNES